MKSIKVSTVGSERVLSDSTQMVVIDLPLKEQLACVRLADGSIVTVGNNRIVVTSEEGTEEVVYDNESSNRN